MVKDTSSMASCGEVIVEVPLTSLKLIGPVSHTSLELVPAPFSCSPPSPRLE